MELANRVRFRGKIRVFCLVFLGIEKWKLNLILVLKPREKLE